MAPPTLPPRPPRKKIKQEIKTEPIEQVWMDQHVSNTGEEFSRPVQTIKREPIAHDAGNFDNPSNADNENDLKETGGDEDTNEGNSGFLILPNGKVQCPKCPKILSKIGNAIIHDKSVHDETKVNCPLCKQSFKNAWYRDRHIKTNHGISPKGLDLKKIVEYGENSGFLPLPNGKVQCMKCQKILSKMGNAKIHYQSGNIHKLCGWIFGYL